MLQNGAILVMDDPIGLSSTIVFLSGFMISTDRSMRFPIRMDGGRAAELIKSALLLNRRSSW